MRIDFITLFPDMFRGFLSDSIIKRAVNKGIVNFHFHNLRDYGVGPRKDVDDYAYGGGAGMVLRPEPVVKCIESLTGERKYDEVIYMAPDGDLLTQNTANTLSMKQNIILLCGRYKGLDQRVRDHWITREISIGDYVLSGGELPAAVLSDSIVRLIPGVLSDESSALLDSFQADLLDAPVYTRPPVFRGYDVPDVLKSGDPLKVDEWRYKQAVEKTRLKRPGIMNGEEGNTD